MIFQNLSRPSCVTFSYNNVSPNVCFTSVAVPFYFILIVFSGININLSFFSNICQPKKKKKKKNHKHSSL